MARHTFYELAERRTESDGSLRRCFRAADDADTVLFIWQRDDASVLAAQLLLDGEAYVEWRGERVTSGTTNRAAGNGTLHARHKGVRTLEARHDATLLDRARLLLSDSDLPAPVVDVLLARLCPTP